MNAELYLECSAKYQEHVEDIFREATQTALAFIRRQKKRKKKKCIILWSQKDKGLKDSLSCRRVPHVLT